MPLPTIIELSDDERMEYERLCRSGKTSVRLKQRLSIVLLAYEGLSNGEIAEHVPLNVMTIGVWRNRFAEQGFEGIVKNRPRGATMNGSRNESYARLREEIIRITTTEKPEGETHWSTRTLATKLKTNSIFVSRVCRDSGLKPH